MLPLRIPKENAMPPQPTKQNRYRARLREQGLRPVQLWVPDTRRFGFAEECRRQAMLIRNDPHDAEILDQLAAVADTDGWLH
jgi:hypothetical protein